MLMKRLLIEWCSQIEGDISSNESEQFANNIRSEHHIGCKIEDSDKCDTV